MLKGKWIFCYVIKIKCNGIYIFVFKWFKEVLCKIWVYVDLVNMVSLFSFFDVMKCLFWLIFSKKKNKNK